MKTVEERLAALEKHSHEPFDFTHLIERIEALEAALSVITLQGEPDGCPDGGACHHQCTNGCWRKAYCSPLSGSNLKDDWTPITNAEYNATLSHQPVTAGLEKADIEQLEIAVEYLRAYGSSENAVAVSKALAALKSEGAK